MSDEILRQAVEGIAELITTQGVINIDFADIKSVMQDAGSAFMGIGVASGEIRAEEAAYAAINSPLLDVAISGAKGVLFAISGGDDMTMHEVHQIAKIVTDSVDPEAKIFFSPIHDARVKKGELKVTVIATGFNPSQKKPASSNGSPFIQRVTKSAPAEEEMPTEKATSIFDSKPDREIEEIGDDDMEAGWSTPAFLRRKK
jgi:cell division protein FtsZ